MNEPDSPPVDAVPESSWLYRVVTRYWLRIVTGLVVVIGWAVTVFGALTANSWLEYYLMAWGGTTAGLWFLFVRAEKALSEDAREKVAGWVAEADLGKGIRSIPHQFALLFDRVFGERHLSLRCFLRSTVASVVAVVIVATLLRPPRLWSESGDPLFVWAGMALLGLMFNAIPDYLSLLETRWAVGWMRRSKRLVAPLLVDLVVTVLISLGWLYVLGNQMMTVSRDGVRMHLFPIIVEEVLHPGWGNSDTFFSIFFYSAFFTSVWLWLYALSVLASRVLLRMNSGVGFLIRVTDVEKKPFTSMGFVSVIIVTVIFALGLPFVLLA
jgi:hypothetical protein